MVRKREAEVKANITIGDLGVFVQVEQAMVVTLGRLLAPVAEVFGPAAGCCKLLCARLRLPRPRDGLQAVRDGQHGCQRLDASHEGTSQVA